MSLKKREMVIPPVKVSITIRVPLGLGGRLGLSLINPGEMTFNPYTTMKKILDDISITIFRDQNVKPTDKHDIIFESWRPKISV